MNEAQRPIQSAIPVEQVHTQIPIEYPQPVVLAEMVSTEVAPADMVSAEPHIHQAPAHSQPGYQQQQQQQQQQQAYYQPSYRQPDYRQHDPGYPVQGYPQSPYQQQGYRDPGYPVQGYQQPDYPPQVYRQFGYPPQPQYQPQVYLQPVLPISKSMPAQNYKRKIRRTVLLVTLALVIFYLINLGVQTAFILGALILDGSLAQYSLLSEEELLQKMPLGLASIAGIALGALAFFMVRGKRYLTVDLTRTDEKMTAKDLLMLIGMMLAVQSIFSLGQIFFFEILQRAGTSLPETIDPFQALMNIPGILYIVLLGPIIEEIMFRGAIMRALQPYGKNFAIVVSSLLFGLYHLFFLQSIFAFFAGLVLAYCAMRFSLKWAILLHIINNGISTALMYFEVSDTLYIGVMLVALALGLIALFPAFSRFKTQLKIGKPTPAALVIDPMPQPMIPLATAVKPRVYALAFSSPFLIAGMCMAAVVMFFTL